MSRLTAKRCTRSRMKVVSVAHRCRSAREQDDRLGLVLRPSRCPVSAVSLGVTWTDGPPSASNVGHGSSTASGRSKRRSTAACDDHVEGRIPMRCGGASPRNGRPSSRTVNAELSALDRKATAFVATGERIIELVKRAGMLYKTQDAAEQRRLLRIGAIELHVRSRPPSRYRASA